MLFFLHPFRTARRAVVAIIVLAGLAAVATTAAQVGLAARRSVVGTVDAIVVMGAAQYDGEPSGALRGRLVHAAELYGAGVAPLVVVTGGNQPGDRTTEGMTGFVVLRELGLPEDAILVEDASTNTWEQLSATAAILAERGLSEVVVVSDPYHNLRLLEVADEVGLVAQVDATDASWGRSEWVRETGAVLLGRIIGFRRLAGFR
ncbi:MAG: YdcF family protein [Actinobacteria bacterium]|nr:YdcF family protein [Actinomycetota bacterium]